MGLFDGKHGFNTTIDPTNVVITGGSINGTTIGDTTRAPGKFTDLIIGDETNYSQINSSGIVTLVGGARIQGVVWIAAAGLKVSGDKPASLVDRGAGIAWEFKDNADGQVKGAVRIDPSAIDLTMPVYFNFGWNTPATTGQAAWALDYSFTSIGADVTIIDDSLQQYAAVPATGANTAGINSFQVDETLINPYTLCLEFTLRRDGNDINDTVGNFVYLNGCCLVFYKTAWG